MKNLIRQGNGSYSQQNIFATASVLLLPAMSLFVFRQPLIFFVLRRSSRMLQTDPSANIVRVYFVFRSLMKDLDVNVPTSMQVPFLLL